MVRPHDVTAVEERAELAVEGGPPPQRLELLLGAAGEVPLQPGVAPEGHEHPQGQVELAVRRVGARAGRRGSPSAPGATSRPVHRWIATRSSASLQSRGPDPVGAVQDAEVDPRASAGARLDLQPRVAPPELVEEPVGGAGLGGDGGPVGPVAVAAHRLVEVAVVVPLDEVDGVLGDEPAHGLEDARVRVGVREVEDVLVAGGERRPRRRPEDPVGVRADEVGVEVEHLGLEPEAELHPQRAHVVDERAEPGGPRPPATPPSRRDPACRRGATRTSRRRGRTARRRSTRRCRRAA